MVMVSASVSVDTSRLPKDILPRLDDLRTHIETLPPGIRTVRVYRDIIADLETPVSAYLKLTDGGTRPGFLLESIEGGMRIARYSFLGADNLATITLDRGECIVDYGDRTETSQFTDPLVSLEEILQGYASEMDPALPRFTGGAVGYLGFESFQYFEPRVGTAEGPGLGLADGKFVIADSLVVFDHLERSMKIVSHVRLNRDEPLEVEYARAVASIEQLTEKLRGPVPELDLAPDPNPGSVESRFRPNTTAERYTEMVEAAKKYIYEGDIFQVVPSQRIDVPTSARPFSIYRALRTINPSPYMFYLDFGDFQVVGASPELLVRLEDGVVTNHPIAGTSPRGNSPAQDREFAERLLADEKERAEHIMLVDLGRNDVGRVAKPGSVRVPRLMEIENFSHVMHIVSHVEGDLREELTGFDALRACFPAGTVSGAPKIRAMEIIAELERDRRGVYAGAVGYFDFSGGIDTCIALRTMVYRDGIASLQAGGGVVADSDPDYEYAESKHKMRALVRAIGKAEEMERHMVEIAEGSQAS
jgi:anthranilate synthase component 1